MHTYDLSSASDHYKGHPSSLKASIKFPALLAFASQVLMSGGHEGLKHAYIQHRYFLSCIFEALLLHSYRMSNYETH